MNTLTIELTNTKAYQLIRDMEEMDLIRILDKKNVDMSSLRKKIKTPMDDAEIDKQLNAMRGEWQRNI